MSRKRTPHDAARAYAREIHAIQRLADALARDCERGARAAVAAAAADSLASHRRAQAALGPAGRAAFDEALQVLIPPDPGRAIEHLVPRVAIPSDDPRQTRDHLGAQPTLPDYLLAAGLAHALAAYTCETESLREVLSDDIDAVVARALHGRPRRGRRAGAAVVSLALIPEAASLDAMRARLRRTVLMHTPWWFPRLFVTATRGAGTRWLRVRVAHLPCQVSRHAPGRAGRSCALRVRCIDAALAAIPLRHRVTAHSAVQYLASALRGDFVDRTTPVGVRFGDAFLPVVAVGDCIAVACEAARVLWAAGEAAAAGRLADTARTLRAALDRAAWRRVPAAVRRALAHRHGFGDPHVRRTELPALSGAGWCEDAGADAPDALGFYRTEGGFELVIGPVFARRIWRALGRRAG